MARFNVNRGEAIVRISSAGGGFLRIKSLWDAPDATPIGPPAITVSTETTISANLIQFHRIVRCHRRLSRLGHQLTVEQTAKLWIGRYAAAFRRSHSARHRPAA
jgi:hypothetical protein